MKSYQEGQYAIEEYDDIVSWWHTESGSQYDVAVKETTVTETIEQDGEEVTREVPAKVVVITERIGMKEPYRTIRDLQAELNEHARWFAEVYDNQVKQYQRCQRLNVPYDEKFGTMDELDAQAISKSARISEIRTTLESLTVQKE